MNAFIKGKGKVLDVKGHDVYRKDRYEKKRKKKAEVLELTKNKRASITMKYCTMNVRVKV